MLEAPVIDTLSDTLLKMKLKMTVSFAFDAGGEWAFDFPPFDGFKIYVLLKGQCWVSVDGDAKEYQMKAGDCVLLTGQIPFLVCTDLPARQRLPAEVLFGTSQNGVTTWNGGGDLFTIGTYFQFEKHQPKIVFERLPALIHIPGDSSHAAVLRSSLEWFGAEYRGNSSGRSLMLNHLAPIMLLQILRVYLATGAGDKNWLMALSDPKLSKAIDAIHADYQLPWSLERLARVAGMSRSGFALSFKKQVGVPPMDYLTNWRMQTACELLDLRGQNIGVIAHAVGYESESAFSFAFKKTIGCRPGSYQKSR